MGIRITDLPLATSITSVDVVPIVQNGDTKKATTQLIVQSLVPVGSASQQGIVQLGTTAGTACDGADARLSNSRIPSGSAGGDLTGAYPAPSLATSGVVAGTFGSPTQIPIFTVDSKGRVTSGTAAILTLSTSQIPVISPTQVGAGITSTQIAGLSAAQIGTGLTSAQITGINVTQVGSLGANVSTFLQTPTSTNLISAITDETGTGSLVFSSSPTLVTPTLTTSTINGYNEGVTTVGSLASTYTLAIATSTVFVLTLASATPCTFTMPAASANKSFVVYLKQPSTGTPTTATFTSVNWAAAVPPTITAALGKMDVFSFFSDGTKWFGTYTQNFTY